jgi:hypothetical protein
MQRGKFLHTQKIKDHKSGGNDVDLSVYGVFETTYDTITRYGKKFETKEEGVKFIQEYKIKWETGSNSTTQEVRDQKIDDILGDN